MYYYNFNEQSIKKFNVFNHDRFLEAATKNLRKCETKKEFAEELRKDYIDAILTYSSAFPSDTKRYINYVKNDAKIGAVIIPIIDKNTNDNKHKIVCYGEDFISDINHKTITIYKR